MRRRRRSRLISDQAWWAAYRGYLEGPVWRCRRWLVLERTGGLCAYCGAPAAQVHHLRYPRHCLPGSRRWLARESLADLQPVCLVCHDRIHA